jgi:conjugative transfer signal peptidase TraF
MTVGLWDRVRNTRRAILIAAGVCVGTFQLLGFLGIRINTSPSLPIGLYITTQDRSTNLVEFCPAEPFATLAIARGYRDSGTCRDGGAPLLKPIVARPGEAVEFSAAGISVNGVRLSNTAPLLKDTKGRPLQPWPFGRYFVLPKTVWVASTYHPRSFDSRYFGPVATSTIRNHLKLLLAL